ncbi:MAG TPA: hypothetical protein VG873_05200 [Burkholderiales bacterium]|nr:hypothetical protein [Burkholderiales bacterium]
MDLRRDLLRLLPGAIAWAEARQKVALHDGERLTGDEERIARAVGVTRPELVRIEMVGDRLPMPDDPVLKAAAVEAGLLGPGMVGLTLGHAIFICRGHRTARLVAHELRHVYQYEQYGSIAAFLPAYLAQVLEVGYEDAPLEQDARAFERATGAGAP